MRAKPNKGAKKDGNRLRESMTSIKSTWQLQTTPKVESEGGFVAEGFANRRIGYSIKHLTDSMRELPGHSPFK